MSLIVLRELGRQLLAARSVTVPTVCSLHNKARIGNREVVGYGINGEPGYIDYGQFPMQSIRFREIKGELIPLKEKEKADWKNLTIDEKKTLYRASFCQTYAEMNVPTGDWKLMVAGMFFCIWVSVWHLVWMSKYVYGELPSSFSEESLKAQFKRMIDMRLDPVEGLASKWDYEKNRWKD